MMKSPFEDEIVDDDKKDITSTILIDECKLHKENYIEVSSSFIEYGKKVVNWRNMTVFITPTS